MELTKKRRAARNVLEQRERGCANMGQKEAKRYLSTLERRRMEERHALAKDVRDAAGLVVLVVLWVVIFNIALSV